MRRSPRKPLALLSVLPLAGVYVLYGVQYQDVLAVPEAVIGLLYLPAALFFTWAVSRVDREWRGLCLFLAAGHLAAVGLTLVFPLLQHLEDHWLLFLPMMLAAMILFLFSPYPLSCLSGWLGKDLFLWVALAFYLVCLSVALRGKEHHRETP